MITRYWLRCRGVSVIVALFLGVVAPGAVSGQGAATGKERAHDVAALQEYSVRVQAYIALQKTVESSLPALKTTDMPEMITAHQEALARKIREARP
jgi:hypothetical protein